MNRCTHVSNNHNIQVLKVKFQNNFRPIANNVLFCFFFVVVFFVVVVVVVVFFVLFFFCLFVCLFLVFLFVFFFCFCFINYCIITNFTLVFPI